MKPHNPNSMILPLNTP